MASFLKAIAPLLEPLGLAWLALLVGSLVALGRRRWGLGGICLAGCAVVWLICQPPFSMSLLARLERPWLAYALQDGPAPAADAVIVLGGGWHGSPGDPWGLNLTAAGDRWITALELCRRERARCLVMGGDALHDSTSPAPDSIQLRRWLDVEGYSEVRLETLGPVGSTRDEAVRARELAERMGWRSVVLVTSAFHMRRAVGIFEKMGLSVHPVACDFHGGHQKADHWSMFPDRDAFIAFLLWWHEQLSWVAHRLLGHL
jgi:uncharacterized SAM-binding protein YcdF (DUF218 family)